MTPTQNLVDVKTIYDYLSKEDFQKIKALAETKPTPFLALNLKKIEKEYEKLEENLDYAKVYYAVKANPNDEVIKLLRDKGSCFDVASRFELDQLFRLGVPPDRISYGNTIKKAKDICYAYEKGVRFFVTDSFSDLHKIAQNAPKSKVYFRLLTECSGADWPLSRKFGAHSEMIIQLILAAKELDIIPYGLSFHVGSQQRQIAQWDTVIAQCKYIFDVVQKEGVELKLINMGGGFPATYVEDTHDLSVYAEEIYGFLRKNFGKKIPEIFIEPGRSLVANAGTIVTEVILLSQKSSSSDNTWMYLDIGKFGGLIETIDESIKFPIFCEGQRKNSRMQSYILAGPTCDSMDILYEHFKYQLPEKIQEGDKIYIMTTGAYTQSYSSVYFNGFPPLEVCLI